MEDIEDDGKVIPELKKLFDEPSVFEELPHKLYGRCVNGTYYEFPVKKHIAKAIEQYVIKASNKWIDVKDRLPEEYKTVLIVYVYGNGNSGDAVGSYANKDWEIYWSDDHPSNRDIKYWREMPSYDLAELKKGLDDDR